MKNYREKKARLLLRSQLMLLVPLLAVVVVSTVKWIAIFSSRRVVDGCDWQQ